MNELLIALAARVHIDPWFCFWIRYEELTADIGSKGAPWLCQPNPMSTTPKSVMPCQLSWQSVVKKSEGSVHARGAAAGVVGAGGAGGVTSAAHASAALKAPTNVSNAERIPSLATSSSRRHGPPLTPKL